MASCDTLDRLHTNLFLNVYTGQANNWNILTKTKCRSILGYSRLILTSRYSSVFQFISAQATMLNYMLAHMSVLIGSWLL